MALALAPFISPHQLIAIQATDLLDQKEQLEGFKALCGLGELKPFECVGSIAESRSAMKYLSTSARWRDKYVVDVLAEFPEIQRADELDLQLTPDSAHCIPDAILAKLDAF